MDPTVNQREPNQRAKVSSNFAFLRPATLWIQSGEAGDVAFGAGGPDGVWIEAGDAEGVIVLVVEFAPGPGWPEHI